MNVIDEFNTRLGEPPALSPHIRDRAKETLMNELMTLEVADSEGRGPRRRRRRVAAAGLVAVAAVAALVVGVGRPGNSPLSPPRASAAVLAIRAAASAQRALPDTPPDLTGVNPEIAALAPNLSDFPTTGTPAEVWSWLDAHCAGTGEAAMGKPVGHWTAKQQAEWDQYVAAKDCGLMGAFAYLQIATPAQRATLLDALATLPKIAAYAGCRPYTGLGHPGTSHDYEVSRNGTDTILSITDTGPGRVLVSMVLWGSIMGVRVAPPCPSVAPAKG